MSKINDTQLQEGTTTLKHVGLSTIIYIQVVNSQVFIMLAVICTEGLNL